MTDRGGVRSLMGVASARSPALLCLRSSAAPRGQALVRNHPSSMAERPVQSLALRLKSLFRPMA